MFIKDIITGRMNFTKFRAKYQAFFLGGTKKPPYHHIVQIGDPVLRRQAKPVNRDIIKKEPFQKFLKHMKSVMTHYKCHGLAASQVGVDMQLFCIQILRNSLTDVDLQDISPVSFQVWINPEMKVIDFNKSASVEGCASMLGYIAEVPRFKRIVLTGLDENGKEKSTQATGYLARVIQHEMDHLKGKMYIDSMVTDSLQCSSWAQINQVGGNVFMYYRNLSWWKQILHNRVN